MIISDYIVFDINHEYDNYSPNYNYILKYNINNDLFILNFEYINKCSLYNKLNNFLYDKYLLLNLKDMCIEIKQNIIYITINNENNNNNLLISKQLSDELVNELENNIIFLIYSLNS
jgi:hypothetical protein